MYAVLGEDRSDAHTIKVLIHRLAGDPSVRVRCKGYNGCGELRRKGSRDLRAYYDRWKCSRFVVCHDADDPDPDRIRKIVEDTVLRPANITGVQCALIPVQEIEAWVLADIEAAKELFRGWAPSPIKREPERIPSPKEHLIKLSRQANFKPRYIPAVHNERIAMVLDLNAVEKRCPSFQPLVDLVRSGKGNYPG